MTKQKRLKSRYESEYDENGLRKCVYCGQWKIIESEYARNGKDAYGNPAYRKDCKVCYNIRRNENRSRSRKSHSDFIGGQKRRGESTPSLSHQEWKECLIFFGGECAYCGSTPRKNKRLTKDHLEAVSKGGETSQDNIVPACSSCNNSKGAEDFKVWYMKQSFFSQERLNKVFKWRTIMRMTGGK